MGRMSRKGIGIRRVPLVRVGVRQYKAYYVNEYLNPDGGVGCAPRWRVWPEAIKQTAKDASAFNRGPNELLFRPSLIMV